MHLHPPVSPVVDKDHQALCPKISEGESRQSHLLACLANLSWSVATAVLTAVMLRESHCLIVAFYFCSIQLPELCYQLESPGCHLLTLPEKRLECRHHLPLLLPEFLIPPPLLTAP